MPEHSISKNYAKLFIQPINATIGAQTKGELGLFVEDDGFISEYGFGKFSSEYFKDNSNSLSWRPLIVNYINYFLSILRFF
jgi:hypothetical protein